MGVALSPRGEGGPRRRFHQSASRRSRVSGQFRGKEGCYCLAEFTLSETNCRDSSLRSE
jgi:hypothetical protein